MTRCRLVVLRSGNADDLGKLMAGGMESGSQPPAPSPADPQPRHVQKPLKSDTGRRALQRSPLFWGRPFPERDPSLGLRRSHTVRRMCMCLKRRGLLWAARPTCARVWGEDARLARRLLFRRYCFGTRARARTVDLRR